MSDTSNQESEGGGTERALIKEKPQKRFDVRQCPISSVVVYRDRAEVKRLVHAQLPAGESEVVVSGLSASVNGDSIRLEVVSVTS